MLLAEQEKKQSRDRELRLKIKAQSQKKQVGKRLKQALQGSRKEKEERDKNAVQRLLVDEFFDMKPLVMPTDTGKDQKKLGRFLYDVQRTINRLLMGCKQLSRLTATELVARPTYTEEFQNIRDNVHEIVTPQMSDNQSSNSKISKPSQQKRIDRWLPQQLQLGGMSNEDQTPDIPIRCLNIPMHSPDIILEESSYE